MSPFLIAIDIGNTNVTMGFGARDGDRWTRIVHFHPDPNRTADEWVSILFPHLTLPNDAGDPGTVMCCSVVPRVTPQLLQAVAQLTDIEPVVVTAATELSIVVGTDEPDRTGTDRLVNANTAYLSFGGPVIIIDTGTATKIEAVNAEGVLVGGVIAPGLGLGRDALAQRAAQLSSVPLEAPPSAIGANTSTAMQSGLVFGHAAMIEGLVRRVQSELGTCRAVVLTGGYHHLLEGELSSVTHVMPTLTLDGLRLLAL